MAETVRQIRDRDRELPLEKPTDKVPEGVEPVGVLPLDIRQTWSHWRRQKANVQEILTSMQKAALNGDYTPPCENPDYVRAVHLQSTIERILVYDILDFANCFKKDMTFRVCPGWDLYIIPAEKPTHSNPKILSGFAGISAMYLVLGTLMPPPDWRDGF